ncbi:MAG: DAK2 domain-containing protein [Anaerolineaceae bacterium]|nr:DAK2 domain-containing protein [Anaerolineaceae bacterium]
MTETSNTNTPKGQGALKTLNGAQWKSMFEAGMLWLKTNQNIVNALNVFPVPDGDTGTNMLLTMQTAWSDIVLLDTNHAGQIMRAAAQGALMGARGNSGVILSQLWRGFSRVMTPYEVFTPEIFSRALTEAKNTAYKGVVRPVEGTILTVLKDTADKVAEALPECDDFLKLLTVTVNAADESVLNTPNLLPVLKQAGVVDSGGRGLFYIFEGFLRWLTGEPLDVNADIPPMVSLDQLNAMNEDEVIEPGQDYEVVVDFHPSKELELSSFYDRLSDMGTSIQVGEGDEMYRMHIHVPTENLYAPINYIMELGTVTKVAIENLMAQMEDIRKAKESDYTLTEVEPGQIGIIAVSPGEGISRVLASLGVNAIISGGQTMNPSTEQILKAVEDLPTDKVIILPNNKNIILSANNAITQSKKQVAVIRSKNVAQGIASMLMLNPDGDFDETVAAMNESLLQVESGELTRATRTVELNGVNVTEGQVIGIHNGELVISADTVEDGLMKLLEQIGTEDYEQITLFYGNGMSDADAEKYTAMVQEKYPDHEVECHYGGQPHYYFSISVE